jgi:hypothetical protein
MGGSGQERDERHRAEDGPEGRPDQNEADPSAAMLRWIHVGPPGPGQVHRPGAPAGQGHARQEHGQRGLAGAQIHEHAPGRAHGEPEADTGGPSPDVHVVAHGQCGDRPPRDEHGGGQAGQRGPAGELRQNGSADHGHELYDRPAEGHARGQEHGIAPDRPAEAFGAGRAGLAPRARPAAFIRRSCPFDAESVTPPSRPRGSRRGSTGLSQPGLRSSSARRL